MSWNYRVTRQRVDTQTELYAIREVYYDDEGNVKLWSTDPVRIGAEDYESLVHDFVLMRDALTKPVLDVK